MFTLPLNHHSATTSKSSSDTSRINLDHRERINHGGRRIRSHNLQHLDISSNNIGPRGMVSLADSLKDTKCLPNLSIFDLQFASSRVLFT